MRSRLAIALCISGIRRLKSSIVAVILASKVFIQTAHIVAWSGGLRNKNPVERVSMDFRKVAYAVKMRRENRQRAKASLTAKVVVFGHGDVAVRSSKALLDRDFPKRRNGVVTFGCVHQVTQRQRKFPRGIDVPEDCVCREDSALHVFRKAFNRLIEVRRHFDLALKRPVLRHPLANRLVLALWIFDMPNRDEPFTAFRQDRPEVVHHIYLLAVDILSIASITAGMR